MSSLRERDILYARLEEVLGAEPAGILMNQIPTESDLATGADMTGLGARFDGLELRFDGLEKRFDGLEIRFDHLEVRFDALEGRVDQLGARMDRLDAHMVRFDDKLDGFHAALREQTRTYMYTMTGVMAAFATVVVASGVIN
jgi:hypothetical protein